VESNKKLITPKVIETQNTSHEVINMGRYNFYDKSPNNFDFTDDDPDQNTEMPKNDHYDFYYNPMEIQKHAGPFMLNDDFISNIQSPTCLSITYPDLITFTTNLEAEHEFTIYTI
jgi:hypothetical protein